MFDEFTRPQLVVYTTNITLQNSTQYFVLKNIGKTSANILSFNPNIDLLEYVWGNPKTRRPFSNIVGGLLAPGQKCMFAMDQEAVMKMGNTLEIIIEYKSTTGKIYSDKTSVRLDAAYDLSTIKTYREKGELATISFALQEMLEKHI